MPAKIIMSFDDEDNVILEVVGAKGKACKDMTREIEKALGSVKESVNKPEFRQVETKTAQRVKAGA